jgi:hypothetical protein
MIRLQRWESGPYFAAFSLRIPDMRSFFNMREIVKICTHSPTVLIEPVFRYRTPKSDRLLGARRWARGQALLVDEQPRQQHYETGQHKDLVHEPVCSPDSPFRLGKKTRELADNYDDLGN